MWGQSHSLCYLDVPNIMMTSSNGNIFALLAICAGNSPVSREFPAQRPVTRSFDVFFDLRPNKRLSKHGWGWWFETPSWSLWRQCNDSLWVSEPVNTKRSEINMLSKLIYNMRYWKDYFDSSCRLFGARTSVVVMMRLDSRPSTY